MVTFAWPLVCSGGPSSSASRAADARVRDRVVVALPKGCPATTWVCDAAVAAGAQAAKLKGSSKQKRKAVAGSSVAAGGVGDGVAAGGGLLSAAGRRGSRSGSTSSAGGGSQAAARGWFEAPCVGMHPYRHDKQAAHQYFAATSWAAVWPVFLAEAVQQSNILSAQVCAGMLVVVLRHDICQVFVVA